MTIVKNSQPEAVTGDSQLIAPRLGTKKDVAKMVNLSVRSVDNLIRAGMPHLKLGSRRCRFDMASVAQWLQEQYGVQRRGAAL